MLLTLYSKACRRIPHGYSELGPSGQQGLLLAKNRTAVPHCKRAALQWGYSFLHHLSSQYRKEAFVWRWKGGFGFRGACPRLPPSPSCLTCLPFPCPVTPLDPCLLQHPCSALHQPVVFKDSILAESGCYAGGGTASRDPVEALTGELYSKFATLRPW